jgi:hypothetical protein
MEYSSTATKRCMNKVFRGCRRKEKHRLKAESAFRLEQSRVGREIRHRDALHL